jgi:hypothetical protein
MVCAASYLTFTDCITRRIFHTQISCLLICNILYFSFIFFFLLWSKYFPLLVVREHFRCVFILASDVHTILFPSLLLEYVWDSLRHIITKDNTPRPPLHLSPQQSCSLSQNMFVAAVIVRLPSLSLYGNPQFRNDIVSIYKMISRKWDPYCWHVHIKELNLSRYKLLDTTKEKVLFSFLCRAIVLDI